MGGGNNVLKWFSLPAVLLLGSITIAQTVQAPQPPVVAQTTPVDVPSNDAFRSQITAIIRSYRAGDTTTGRLLIDQFRLPHSQDWFSEYLGPEQGAKLAERYDRLYANFAESFEKTVETIVANRESDLSTNLENGKGETPSGDRRPGARLSGMVSTRQPSLYFVHFQITVRKQESTSWADTFVHEDGTFRFIGFGAWPFWAWEDGAEGSAPVGGSFGSPPILISKVNVVYPPAARARSIEGVVVVSLLIDQEGRVKKADVVQGDALLTQAALDAVRQWRYNPGTLGGVTVESEVMANVSFLLN
jgi:TonB family protein